MAVFSPLVLIILSILLMTLYLHWILTRKLKRWSHLPGPSSPLVFLIMSAFSSDNSVLLRRFYTKYQKNGFCFVPLMNIPLLFLGDYRIIKYFSSHPGLNLIVYRNIKLQTKGHRHVLEQMVQYSIFYMIAACSSQTPFLG